MDCGDNLRIFSDKASKTIFVEADGFTDGYTKIQALTLGSLLLIQDEPTRLRLARAIRMAVAEIDT